MLSVLPTIARWGAHGGWAGPWWPLAIVFWIILIAAVVWAIRRFNGSPLSESTTALDILEARYARGEIETDDYRKRRDELRGPG